MEYYIDRIAKLHEIGENDPEERHMNEDGLMQRFIQDVGEGRIVDQQMRMVAMMITAYFFATHDYTRWYA